MTEPFDTLYFIGGKILDWGIPFALGLIFRKSVGRFLIKLKKYLSNDVVNISVLCIHSYKPNEVTEVNHDLYDDIKIKIPSTKLLNFFPEGIRISVPVFGILRVLVEKEYAETEDPESSELAPIEAIKTTLTPESPVRLGIREIDKLNDLANYSEIIFGEIEKCCFSKAKVLQSYILLDIPRMQRFKEEKTFKIEDKELGASVNATPSDLTLIVSPMGNVGKATKKYILV